MPGGDETRRGDALSGGAARGPSGAALAPLRAHYLSWLRLDREQVRVEREEDPAEIRALQLVLRMERDTLPSWHAALVLAARGCAALCLDARAEPGGEWYEAVRAYCSGHIRKVTRRARAGHWSALDGLPGIALQEGDTQVRALLPGLAAELDRLVARLQVAGTDIPRDPAPHDRPEPDPPVPELRIWPNPSVTMTLGKAMAQAGHAGMIAAALLAGTNVDALSRWHAGGLRALARVPSPARFERMQQVLTDPSRAWTHHGLLAVRDAGFTEIPMGTVTVIAEAPLDPSIRFEARRRRPS